MNDKIAHTRRLCLEQAQGFIGAAQQLNPHATEFGEAGDRGRIGQRRSRRPRGQVR
jgi:hypothetical protein